MSSLLVATVLNKVCLVALTFMNEGVDIDLKVLHILPFTFTFSI